MVLGYVVNMACIKVGKGREGEVTVHGKVVIISGCNGPWKYWNEVGGDQIIYEWLEVTFRFC
jgi:hypothetical protein